MAFAEAATSNDFRFQFAVIAKIQPFAYANFSSGADQAFPFVGLLLQLPGQQDLDASVQKIARGGILRAERLRFESSTAAIQPRGKDLGVVEDYEIAGTKQVRKFAKPAVLKRSRGS